MKIKTKIITSLFIMQIFCLQGQCFKYGVIGGLDMTNIDMVNFPNEINASKMYNPIISFNINSYLEYKSKSFWGLSIEPGFAQKGGTQLFSYSNFDTHYTNNYNVIIRLNYFQLPVLYHVYLTDKFYLSIGSEFSYLINSTAKVTDVANIIDSEHSNVDSNIRLYAYDSNQNNSYYKNNTNNFEKHYDISGLVGVNYKINKHTDIGLRYSYSFTNLGNIDWMDSSGSYYGSANIRNRDFQLLIKEQL